MKFVINIKPKGKGRPRFVRKGNFVSTYTPSATKEYEIAIKNAFIEQCKEQDRKEYMGAVKVRIWAYFCPPKSLSKKKKEELIGKAHLKKPDADNIAKSVLDSINGVAWKDDSQVSDVEIHKYYGIENKIEVEIEYVDERNIKN